MGAGDASNAPPSVPDSNPKPVGAAAGGVTVLTPGAAQSFLARGAVALTATSFAVAGGVLALTASGWVLVHGPKGDITDGPSYWLPGVPAENSSKEHADRAPPHAPAVSTPVSTPADPCQHDPSCVPKQAESADARLKKPSYRPGASDGGPGQWAFANEGMKDLPTTYQNKITGAPNGMIYRVQNPLTKKGVTKFDSYDSATNTLIDAKRWTGWPIGKQFSTDSVLEQANAQISAAGSSGARIRWVMSSQEKAGLV